MESILPEKQVSISIVHSENLGIKHTTVLLKASKGFLSN